jgi:hypothetical protein
MDFDMQDFDKLNSATKYPSIDTYHVLGERGMLTEELGPFKGVGEDERVFLTEKVDGTNGRIVLLPGGDYFIGSREELLYAKGDRVKNPNLNIVPVLAPLAEHLVTHLKYEVENIEVLYLEVYGGKIGGQAKNYSKQGQVGYRLFDHAFIGPDVLSWSREDISRWRENGGQPFHWVEGLQAFAEQTSIPLVPYIIEDSGADLPQTVEEAHEYLSGEIQDTRVELDGEPGKAEGLVLRTGDRSRIAKMRFQDYERTLKRRGQK